MIAHPAVFNTTFGTGFQGLFRNEGFPIVGVFLALLGLCHDFFGPPIIHGGMTSRTHQYQITRVVRTLGFPMHDVVHVEFLDAPPLTHVASTLIAPIDQFPSRHKGNGPGSVCARGIHGQFIIGTLPLMLRACCGRAKSFMET